MPRSLQILAIADDATGALEVGGQLAMLGVHALVTMDGALNAASDALVVDVETRHVTSAKAAAAVSRLAADARRIGLPFLYKKTDSTLRGNVASEFQALLDAFPERVLIYVPAYPKMRRTVLNGELFVDGTPLANTAFARDALNPSREGKIPTLLSGGCRAPVAVARSAGELGALLRSCLPGSVIVCDGASDDDLRETAAEIVESKRECIVAGTGGFAGEWVEHLPVPRSEVTPRPRVERCLVVAGSRHPASQEQVRRAAGSIFTLYLDQQPDDETARCLSSRDWAALATTGDSPAGVGSRLKAVVRRLLAQRPVDGLVIFGGDTALAVLASLGVDTVRSVGELLPGIPISLANHRGRDIVLVTKAGGFGEPETLLTIKEQLGKRQ